MYPETTASADELSVPSLSSESHSAIDARAFLTRCLGNAAFALTILDEFEISLAQRIDELTLLSVNDELQSMADVAHSLKGAAAIVGAEEIRATAAEIEAAGRADEVSRLPVLIRQLHTEIKACLNSIPELRRQLQRLK